MMVAMKQYTRINDRMHSQIDKDRAYYIIENFISRIEDENFSVRNVTKIEFESLRLALKLIEPKDNKPSEFYVSRHGKSAVKPQLGDIFDDDDIPF